VLLVIPLSCAALISSFLPRPPPTSTLFPYTTLFRSDTGVAIVDNRGVLRFLNAQMERFLETPREVVIGVPLNRLFFHRRVPRLRSEEHTSELQSRENLVCRLLLEKKKK